MHPIFSLQYSMILRSLLLSPEVAGRSSKSCGYVDLYTGKFVAWSKLIWRRIVVCESRIMPINGTNLYGRRLIRLSKLIGMSSFHVSLVLIITVSNLAWTKEEKPKPQLSLKLQQERKSLLPKNWNWNEMEKKNHIVLFFRTLLITYISLQSPSIPSTLTLTPKSTFNPTAHIYHHHIFPRSTSQLHSSRHFITGTARRNSRGPP